MAEHKKVKEVMENVQLKTTSQTAFKERNYLFIFLLFVVTVALAVLTFLVKLNPVFPLDLAITRSIQTFHPVWFDIPMKILTYIGNPLPATVIVILTGGILLLVRRYKEGGIVLFSSTGMTIISTIAKDLVGRARPSPSLVHQIVKYTRNDSFPSGHVLFYVGFFGILLFLSFSLLKKGSARNVIITVLSILIAFIGMSRIYLGAHWFSDVMGAYLLGFLWLTLVVFIYRRLSPKAKVQ